MRTKTFLCYVGFELLINSKISLTSNDDLKIIPDIALDKSLEVDGCHTVISFRHQQWNSEEDGKHSFS